MAETAMNDPAVRRRRRRVALAGSLAAAGLAVVLARAGGTGVLAAPFAWACLLLVWVAAAAPMLADDWDPRHPLERSIGWTVAVVILAAISRWSLPEVEGPLVPVLAVAMTACGWFLAWAYRRRDRKRA